MQKLKILGVQFLQKHPMFGSSEDPTKLSRTIQNFVPFVVLLLATFNINIPQTEIDTYVLALCSVLTGGSTIYYGVLRILNWYKNRQK